MIADHLRGIEKFEAEPWKIADNLRANSSLASNEYFMPIMGLIFLRHATNRFYEAKAAIEADKAAGKMPDRRSSLRHSRRATRSSSWSKPSIFRQMHLCQQWNEPIIQPAGNQVMHPFVRMSIHRIDFELLH
jgi:HsdM N-terminal domain